MTASETTTTPIEQVLSAMTRLLEQLNRGAAVRPDILRDLSAFLGAFAAGCHCSRERQGQRLALDLATALDGYMETGSSALPRLADAVGALVEFYSTRRVPEVDAGPEFAELPARLERVLGRMSGASRPGGPRRARYPSLRFDLAERLDALHQDPGWNTGRSSRILLAYPDLRVVLTALRAGVRVQEHHGGGRIVMQLLAGLVRLDLGGQWQPLAAGELLGLDHAVPHNLEALEDSAYLLTISWPGGQT